MRPGLEWSQATRSNSNWKPGAQLEEASSLLANKLPFQAQPLQLVKQMLQALQPLSWSCVLLPLKAGESCEALPDRRGRTQQTPHVRSPLAFCRDVVEGESVCGRQAVLAELVDELLADEESLHSARAARARCVSPGLGIHTLCPPSSRPLLCPARALGEVAEVHVAVSPKLLLGAMFKGLGVLAVRCGLIDKMGNQCDKERAVRRRGDLIPLCSWSHDLGCFTIPGDFLLLTIGILVIAI